MIIIDGVPGVGKTTFQRELCARICNTIALEQDFQHNICLEDFYQGERCVFQKQMIFLFSDYHLMISAIRKNPGKIIISDYSLERSRIMANRYLSAYEYNALFSPCYDYLSGQIHVRHKLLILLYASPDYILKNIKKRDRAMERGIQLREIQQKQDVLLQELPKAGFEKHILIDCEKEDIKNSIIVDKYINAIIDFEQI